MKPAPYLLSILLAVVLSAGAQASECSLTVSGETLEYNHVLAVPRPNWADPARQDIEVYCFREEVPAANRSASAVIWVALSDRIVITLSPSGDVTSVNITTEALTAGISGFGFGVDFDGELTEDDRLVGEIITKAEIVSLTNGKKGPSWMVSATLDIEPLPE